MAMVHTYQLIWQLVTVSLIGLHWGFGLPEVGHLGSALIMVIALCLGMPHGGMDLFWMCRHKGSYHSLLPIVAVYSLSAVFLFQVWIVFPFFSLIMFLVISVWHWSFNDAPSLDWSQDSSFTIKLHRLAYGSMLITLMGVNHEVALTQWLALILANDAAQMIAHGMHLLGTGLAPVYFIGFCYFVYVCRSILGKQALALSHYLVFGLAALTLPPMWAFLVGYLLHHSVWHLIALKGALNQTDSHLFTKWLAALVGASLLVCVLLWWVLFTKNLALTVVVQTGFGVVFAVTIPHALYVYTQMKRIQRPIQ